MKNRYITIIFILLSSFISSKLIAQNQLNLASVDRLTYQYYNEQKWEELIKLGETALDEDIDFYYLQYRMGVAYYSEKKYRKAIPFFENIIKITPYDTVAKEYLYYSYLFGARTADATKTLYTLDNKHKLKVEFHKTNNLLNGLGVEYKYFAFDDFAISNTVDSEIVQKTRNTMNYFSADIINYTQNNSSFYFNSALISGNNSVYNSEYSPEVIDEELKQYQLFVSWDKNIGTGLSFNVSLSYMRENLIWYDNQYTGTGVSIYDESTNNFVGTLSFSKNQGDIDFSIGSSISNINDEKQSQPFVDITWYPFSNKAFYSKTKASYQYNFNNNNDNFVFKQTFIAEINSRLSVKAFGLYGKIYNYVDDNGLSIYNNLDAIEYWYGVSANYYFNNTAQMYLSYRNDRQTNNYTDNSIDKEISYNVNSVLMGLRFSF